MTSPSPPRLTSRMRKLASTCLLACFFAFPVAAIAQQISPQELVREAIQNEANDNSHSLLFTWMERNDHGQVSQTERLVDTPQGTVSRVVLIDGKPLTPEQQRAEDQRIHNMMDPAQMRRKLKERQEDDEHTRKLLSAIPDAFDFQFLGSYIGPNGHKFTRLAFTPRPGFNPPSRESAVFTGMRGTMLVDETTRRIAQIDGMLFKEVNFGWGILGKLYKGGRFFIEKSEVTPTHWETTRTILHFDGKILLLKPLHLDDNETDWDYQPVPPMTAKQAFEFLTRGHAEQNADLSAD
jgi:hypothetical protein